MDNLGLVYDPFADLNKQMVPLHQLEDVEIPLEVPEAI